MSQVGLAGHWLIARGPVAIALGRRYSRFARAARAPGAVITTDSFEVRLRLVLAGVLWDGKEDRGCSGRPAPCSRCEPFGSCAGAGATRPHQSSREHDEPGVFQLGADADLDLWCAPGGQGAGNRTCDPAARASIIASHLGRRAQSPAPGACAARRFPAGGSRWSWRICPIRTAHLEAAGG